MTARERKQQTEHLLTTLGIPTFHELPHMEEESEVQLRSAREIAERIIVLTYLNCIASPQKVSSQVIEFLKKENLWDKATSSEQQLFLKEELTEEEVLMIGWKSEAIWLLLWVVNKTDALGLPISEVNPHQMFDMLPFFGEPSNDFISSVQTRDLTEILDQSDLIFRLMWALQHVTPGSLGELDLNTGVIFERYHALNWVTKLHAEWD